MAFIGALLKWADSEMALQDQKLPVQPINIPTMPPAPTLNQRIYREAKADLGKHLTLNSNVPPDVGCAEAVSFILKMVGVPWIPKQGVAGTAQLWELLKANARLTTQPQPGNIIISPTGTSEKGVQHGHVGIVLEYGIGSNDSNSGLFRENYTLGSWSDLFHTQLGFPIYTYDLDV